MTSQTPPPAKKPVSLFLLALLIGLVLLSVPLVIGFFGRVHPAFDSFAHFRAHLALIMAAGGALLLFTQLRREAIMVTLLGLSAFSTTVNWSGVAQQGVDHSDTVRYKLMQINLLQKHADPREVLQAVARNQPDIITYQEASNQWQPWLKILEATYPYHHQCIGSSRHADGPVAFTQIAQLFRDCVSIIWFIFEPHRTGPRGPVFVLALIQLFSAVIKQKHTSFL